MICPNCGASLEEGQKVCPDCGQTIVEGDNWRKDYLSSTIEYTPGEPLSRRRGKSASQPVAEVPRKRRGRKGRGAAEASMVEFAAEEAPGTEQPAEEVSIPQESAPKKPQEETSVDKPQPAAPQAAQPEEPAPVVDDPAEPERQEQDAEPAHSSEEAVQEPREAAPENPPSRRQKSENQLVEDEHIDLSSTLKKPKREKEDRGPFRTFVKWLCIFVTLAVLGVGAHLLVTHYFVTWPRFFNTVFGKEVEPPFVPAAVVEITEEDGKYIRTFSVHGEDTYTLIVDSLGGKEIKFQDGVAKISIEDSVWISEVPDPNLEYLEVNLKMRVMDELGYTSDVEVDPFLVYVPQTPVEFEFPNADLSRVYEDTATLVFTPPSGSTVIINGENVTNKTDESGTVRYSIPVQMGDNTVSFEATMPFARPLTKEFILKRTLHDVVISLSQEVPSRTEAETYVISGTVETGASLTTDFPGGGIQLDSATGSFTFQANLGSYGLHQIVFHATKEGKEPTDLTVTIERIPNPRTFASSAVSPAVGDFIASPGNYKDQALYFNGMVQTTDQENQYDLDIGGQLIGFTYNGSTKLHSGDEVRIYGSYDSVDGDGKPYLMVWFITK